MKTRTIREKLNAWHRSLITRVSSLTGLDEDSISLLVFERGAEYIEGLADDSIANLFKSDPLYWSWWRQQWAIIDEVFLHKIPKELSQKEMLRVYHDMHANIDTYPDSVIWDKIHKSYGKMAGKIIKKQE